jgi:hypothetical protein
MYKLKNQIEGQIQEIVFFSSLLLAFSVFISGLSYLVLGSSGLELVIGSFGASIDRGFFSAFGYGFFYLAFAALHLGSITNFHIFNFTDLKREYPVLAYSALAHIILLTLFSNLLSIIQFALEIPASESLPYGAGGMVGSFIAKGLYSAAGVYGSILLIVTFKVITGLVAEFFELKDLHNFLKNTAQTTKRVSFRFAKSSNKQAIKLIQTFFGANEFSGMAYQSSQATKHWISNSVNRANNLFTENFHIYQRPVVVSKEETEKVKTIKKLEARKKAARTATEKLLGTPKDPVKAATAPVAKLDPKTASKPEIKSASKPETKLTKTVVKATAKAQPIKKKLKK